MGFNATIDWIANGKKKGAQTVFDENNISNLSIPKQTKIYLEKLKQIGSSKGSKIFDYSDLNKIAKDLNL